MGNLAASIIPAGAAIAGVIVTGLFALWTQRATRKAEEARWRREARARFHDTRLHAYADFLEQAANAKGYMVRQAIKRRGQPADYCTPADLTEDDFARLDAESSEHPEYNGYTPAQMTTRQIMVMILASSVDIRDAANDIVQRVLLISAIPGDDPMWNEQFMATLMLIDEARDRFVHAVNAELAA